MDISIPNPPASLADCITLLTVGGVDCLKPAFTEAEAIWGPEGTSPDPAKYRRAKHIHSLLNTAGYLAEDLFGVPDGTFGAGGGGKPPW